MVAATPPFPSPPSERGAGGSADARLLPGRGFRRTTVLALPRRYLRPRDGTGALVRAWAVCMTAYAELAVTTNFSFLRGASHPEEMVATADALGLAAIGITDRNSFAGVVRAYAEAKDRTIKLIVGVRLVTDAFEVLAYPLGALAFGA